jgi:hypothetical protein
MGNQNGIVVEEMEERTVLDAIGAPLALRDLTKYRGAVCEQLVNDPVLAISSGFSRAR